MYVGDASEAAFDALSGILSTVFVCCDSIGCRGCGLHVCGYCGCTVEYVERWVKFLRRLGRCISVNRGICKAYMGSGRMFAASKAFQ